MLIHHTSLTRRFLVPFGFQSQRCGLPDTQNMPRLNREAPVLPGSNDHSSGAGEQALGRNPEPAGLLLDRLGQIEADPNQL